MKIKKSLHPLTSVRASRLLLDSNTMGDSDEELVVLKGTSKKTQLVPDVPQPVNSKRQKTQKTEKTCNVTDGNLSAVSDSLKIEPPCTNIDRDDDETGDPYVEDLFNSFIEVHPMTAAIFNSNEAFNLLSRLPPRGQIPDLQVVPRSHDNAMLRPPNEDVGERPCVNGNKCWCYWLGKHRHGVDDPRTFVCTEYLLPQEQTAWRNGELRLPEHRKKCLLCERYFLHAIFLRIKQEPEFRAQMCGKQLQEFRNDIAMHTHGVETHDGYPESRLLSIQEKGGQEEPLMLWPVVGFNTKHYRFEVRNGRPYAVQLGMVPRVDLNGQPSNA